MQGISQGGDPSPWWRCHGTRGREARGREEGGWRSPWDGRRGVEGLTEGGTMAQGCVHDIAEEYDQPCSATKFNIGHGGGGIAGLHTEVKSQHTHCPMCNTPLSTLPNPALLHSTCMQMPPLLSPMFPSSPSSPPIKPPHTQPDTTVQGIQ